MKQILVDLLDWLDDFWHGCPHPPRGMVFVRRYNERMINWGMGKTFWEIWFCPKTNRNYHRFVVL